MQSGPVQMDTRAFYPDRKFGHQSGAGHCCGVYADNLQTLDWIHEWGAFDSLLLAQACVWIR